MAAERRHEVFVRRHNWRRQHMKLKLENEPYVEQRKRSGDVETLLRIFMQVSDDSPECFYQFAEMDALCPDKHLQDLKLDRLDQIPTNGVAWLDERRFGKKSKRRTGDRILNVRELYKALKRKRFNAVDASGEAKLPDVHRRLIYITDLDNWTVPVLVLTASEQQVPFLQSFFQNHFEPRASLSITFSPGIGSHTFALEFHFPFHVWRSSDEPNPDKRRGADKDTPLRKATNVSALLGKNPKSNTTDWLYQAKASCLITGYNGMVWTAFYCVDTFFDGEKSGDHVSHCEDGESIGFHLDPLTRCKHDAENPIWDPREYFLLVMGLRLRYIVREWKEVVLMMNRRIASHERIHGIQSRQSGFSLWADPEHAKSIWKSYKWTGAVSGLLTELIHNLSEMLRVWHTFVDEGVMSFTDENSPDAMPNKCRTELRKMQSQFWELQNLRMDLVYSNERCKDSRREFELYLLVQGSQAIDLQKWSMTILNLFSPIALSASILQSGVLPYQPAGLIFVCLSVFFWLLTLLIRPLATFISTILDSFNQWFRLSSKSEKTESNVKPRSVEMDLLRRRDSIWSYYVRHGCIEDAESQV